MFEKTEQKSKSATSYLFYLYFSSNIIYNGSEVKQMNVLISACLLGCKCRYDGKDKNTIDITKLKEKYTLFPICPELDGGLGVPREPAEIKEKRVINRKGIDVTKEYTKGAEIALETALKNNCTVAILKARSPSCGKGEIYDGSFTKTLINGDGIKVRVLKEAGIRIYTENEIDMITE